MNTLENWLNSTIIPQCWKSIILQDFGSIVDTLTEEEQENFYKGLNEFAESLEEQVFPNNILKDSTTIKE